jgi:hypothetical protein
MSSQGFLDRSIRHAAIAVFSALIVLPCFVAGFLIPDLSARPAETSARPLATATITFRKVFKQSFPEFVEIKINDTGAATYDIRQLDDEASPQCFDVSRPIVDKIFQLAAQLHHFDGLNLDVHRKIANLGEKTFRYESGSESHEVTFNYTLDANATALLDLFEGLGRQQIDLSNLQRAMRYDRLGVNDALLRIEADLNNKLLPEPDRLLPALDQAASNDKFLDIAPQRARSLAARIRNPRS